jgi:OOP family OmpA-OmpF porin
MSTIIMKLLALSIKKLFMRCAILFMLITYNSIVYCQNLVPNPGFEEINGTIGKFSNANQFNEKIKHWTAVNSASPDLITPDFFEPFIKVSSPKSGLNTAGIRSSTATDFNGNVVTWGEYIGVKLLKDLVPNKTYYVEYWIRRAKNTDPAKDFDQKLNPLFGMLFYLDSLIKTSDCEMISANPQIKVDTNLLIADKNWVKISQYFTPKSTYNKICLGQFSNANETISDKHRYYQIDDVLIEELYELDTFDKNGVLAQEDIFPLNQIQFKTGSAILNDKKSFKQLNIVVSFLKLNPSIHIRVHGHTDSIGNKESNINLSKMRAQFVAHYLSKSGISKNRILWEGHGDQHPFHNNSTVKGRSNNRRVEIEIIEN